MTRLEEIAKRHEHADIGVQHWADIGYLLNRLATADAVGVAAMRFKKVFADYFEGDRRESTELLAAARTLDVAVEEWSPGYEETHHA